VADDKVICILSASSECSEEVSIAKKKAEVLEQAIGKPLQFFMDIAGQPVLEIPITGTVSLRHEQM